MVVGCGVGNYVPNFLTYGRWDTVPDPEAHPTLRHNPAPEKRAREPDSTAQFTDREQIKEPAPMT